MPDAVNAISRTGSTPSAGRQVILKSWARAQADPDHDHHRHYPGLDRCGPAVVVEEVRELMAKTYRVDGTQRLINKLYGWLTERGFGADFRQILTVRGRRSGEPRSLPIDVLEVDGHRWLVSPYGLVSWVYNVRGADVITLRRGGSETSWRATEVTGPEVVPVIRAYLRAVPVTHPYWDITADSSDAEILAAAPRHPVFRLTPEY
jgi:hypothetical protein